MFWGQGGELVDRDGQPVFGLPPNRDRMIRLMRFLRATIETGASPRSVSNRSSFPPPLRARCPSFRQTFFGA